MTAHFVQLPLLWAVSSQTYLKHRIRNESILHCIRCVRCVWRETALYCSTSLEVYWWRNATISYGYRVDYVPVARKYKMINQNQSKNLRKLTSCDLVQGTIIHLSLRMGTFFFLSQSGTSAVMTRRKSPQVARKCIGQTREIQNSYPSTEYNSQPVDWWALYGL